MVMFYVLFSFNCATVCIVIFVVVAVLCWIKCNKIYNKLYYSREMVVKSHADHDWGNEGAYLARKIFVYGCISRVMLGC
jgi:hypothetical protein